MRYLITFQRATLAFNIFCHVQRKKILIVDEEPHVTLLIQQFLQRAGYRVKIALNGEQALTSIAQDRPDLIVTDVQMPKMNGLQLCEHVLQQERSQPFLILMTSRTDREIRIWAQNYPKIELMEKPLSMRKLINRVNMFFAEGKS